MEILAPAGNQECALAAIHSGADAIYLGYSAFSARAGAENFDETVLAEVIKTAHFSGVKVYLAMNTLVKEGELDDFFSTLLKVWRLGVDAIILQDIFLGKYIRERYPQIVLHLSTQAGVCSLSGALLAKEMGFSRVILARETPISEIKKICGVIETEVFVQGALCTCFSGQCYFSSFVGGNSGNRGRCKQPCRKRYAYNRNGFEEKAYALSLSDLSVGEDIFKLIDAGVLSFKIEGRMRRKEYVAAAVQYYRSIVNKSGEAVQAFSDLKRAYNRGNFTKGLAFGQDKRFLSRVVQGHLGEKVGTVKVINGKYFVESSFQPVEGDAFKILREGKEVGGAFFEKRESRGFTLSKKLRLKNGDGVFVTTDTQSTRRLLSKQQKEILSLSIRFSVGERAVVSGGGVDLVSDFILEEANSSALSEEELKRCFEKVDGLPVGVHFEEIALEGKAFVPKSLLNGFRREFYKKLFEKRTKNQNAQYQPLPIEKACFTGENGRIAAISNDFTGLQPNVGIYKPNDYSLPLPQAFLNGEFEKYLYCPPFATEEELESIFSLAKENGLNGVYADTTAALLKAKQTGLKLFAGTGFNITNSLSLKLLLSFDCVSYYALSKELSVFESSPLVSSRAFALSLGDIKLMDLCYCPFEKTCKTCDKRNVYTLTDENGREFPVRRYTVDGNCRFEAYNCASLIGAGVPRAGKLAELTVTPDKCGALKAVERVEEQKRIYKKYTSGHAKNGVL